MLPSRECASITWEYTLTLHSDKCHGCGCSCTRLWQQPICVQITALQQVLSETQATGDQLAVATDDVAALMAQLAAARAVVTNNQQEAQGFRVTAAGAS